jgi:hypothetical protein
MTGILAGASLDQSIKQLPARHKMDVIAFSAYARAADLGNGIVWYAFLGISAALLTLVAAVLILLGSSNSQALTIMTLLAAALAVIHTIATSQAAPIYLGLTKVAGDEKALTALFNRFEARQTIRAVIQTINFAVLLGVVYLYITHF